MSRVTEMVVCLGLYSQEVVEQKLKPGLPEPRPIQHSKAYNFLCADVCTEGPGLGMRDRKARTDVIRGGPLLFGFTSNKDDSRETEAPTSLL